MRGSGGLRGGGMRVGGGEQRVLSMRSGAVLLARVPAHGLEDAQAAVHAAGRKAAGGISVSKSGSNRSPRLETDTEWRSSARSRCARSPPCRFDPT